MCSDCKTCVCGESKKYEGLNCAHHLTNYMIANGLLDKDPSGCYCCSSGRPIRAKEVRTHVFAKKFTKQTEEPAGNAYIYCETDKGQGHVYYGTKSTNVHGTGSVGDFSGDNWTTIEYYV